MPECETTAVAPERESRSFGEIENAAALAARTVAVAGSTSASAQITPITSVLSAHFVVVDGLLVGGWRRTLSRHEVVITAQLLRPLTALERKALERAAARYAQSLGLAFRLEADIVR